MKIQLSDSLDFQRLSIYARDLRKEYAKGRGVTGIDLEVSCGECLCILGRNGSGKTTIARLILGLDRPDSGTLLAFGRDCGKRRPPFELIGAVIDTSTHWDALTGRENAHFASRAYGVPPPVSDGRLRRLLRIADLEEQADDPVSTYSYGMRRKLSFIQALCSDPRLLLLDEPTIGMDSQFLIQLRDIILARTHSGKCTLITSNDPDWCADVATRIAFIEKGAISAMGTVEDLTAEVGSTQEMTVQLQNYAVLKRPEIEGIRSFNQSGKDVIALLDQNPAIISSLISALESGGAIVHTIAIKQSSLKDAFLLKTGKVLAQ